MAAGNRLVLEFGDASDNSISFTYNYANATATVQDVRAAMNAFIANGSIFKYPPVSIKSAKIITTSESVFNL